MEHKFIKVVVWMLMLNTAQNGSEQLFVSRKATLRTCGMTSSACSFPPLMTIKLGSVQNQPSNLLNESFTQKK